VKLSCLPVSLYADFNAGRRSLVDWFRFAAELGLDGADISVAHLPSLDPADLDELRRQAHNAGVQIPMMVTYSDFTHPDAAARARQADEVRAYITAAQRLGVSLLRVTAGQAHPETSRADGLDWAVAGLTSCLDDAERAHVTLIYENHTKGSVWTYNDFSQPAEIFLEIVERTRGSNLRLLFDTANTLATGDDPLAVLEQVKHRIAAVHVNDIRREGYFEPVVVGQGVAPIREIFSTLVQAGFDGWVSVEEASMTGEDGFRRAIPRTEEMWISAGGAARAARSG
jgi:sugar phosphate isomerase/epimerase